MEKIVNTKIIAKYMFDNYLTKTAFCRQCNICLATFYKIFNNENVTLAPLNKISKAINVPIDELYSEKF